MKTQTKILKTFILIAFLALGCSKSDDSNPGEITGEEKIEKLPGVKGADLGEYKGAIGISFSARDIAKKGHKPAKAVISITANTGDYGATVNIDEYTNIGQLSLDVESLGEDAKNELEDGTPINVQILDENDVELASESFPIISFKSNPEIKEVDDTDIEDLFADLNLRDDITYYMQIKNSDNNEIIGAPSSVNYPNSSNLHMPLLIEKNLDYNTDLVKNFTAFLFTEVPDEEGVYNISIKNGDDIHYVYLHPSAQEFRIQTKANLNNNGANSNASAIQNYKFKIEKVDEGLYTITALETGNPLVLENDETILKAGASTVDKEPAYFRIFSMAIDWEIESLESLQMEPVLPPVDTGFGFNSTLRNCGSGNLDQEVGIERTIETSTTVGWEESISLSSTETFGASLTVGVKTEASFFGSGVEVSAEATASYEYSSEATSSSSEFEENTKVDSQTYFSNRTVNVPSGKASQVYDAYQLYTNVSIPFVKRFRVQGTYQDNSEALTGGEISTQFAFNNFNGVITKVEDVYIEVTVRGTTVLSNYVETESNVKDVPSNCN